MLYLLTGEIQTGKTRWLEARVAEAEAAGVEVHGVLSPGEWAPTTDGGFEKKGIDLVFYPSHERVRFADRLSPDDVTDEDEDGYDEPEVIGEMETLTGAPLAGEGMAPHPVHADGRTLGWKFYSYWFGQGNALFAELRRDREPAGTAKRLVVIDEIGRLELNGRGFSEALAFLMDGESPAYPNVVAIVRSELLERTRTLLDPIWGDRLQVIHPHEYKGAPSIYPGEQ